MAAVETGNSQEIEEELGDLLLTLTSIGRHLNIDSESALRTAISNFSRRFRHVEKELREISDPESISIDRLEQLWEEAKLAQKG